MTADPVDRVDPVTPAERAGARRVATAPAWVLPALFAAFLVITVWCAVALLADHRGVGPAPARTVPPAAALRLG